jgi:uncharacterized protein (TIGR00255 family)
MPLSSMTGFARADGAHSGAVWHWELRSVNGRGLDLRFRFPPGYEALEQRVREACGAALARGNCSVSLNVKSESHLGEIRLNEQALRQAMAAAARAREIAGGAPVELDTLLTLKGVIETGEAEETSEVMAARLEAMFQSFTAALSGLVKARESEGRRLRSIIALKLDEIAALTGDARRTPSRAPEAVQKRLSEQVGRLMATTVDLDQSRLYQEAVLLSVKADVEEELERLDAHVSGARELLDADAPVGRKLEFLAQEFQREANTLCAKSNAPDVTRAGLALKSAIDQLREQVQNIE